jgi:hypothetical protein
MVMSVCCAVKEIFEKGKDYAWPRPERCPRCGVSHVWGHGFVPAYFDGFSGFVYLRRWRCPGCWCVIRVRPCGFFRRFQAPIEEIRFRLSSRVLGGHWPPGMSHTRQGHWLRALCRRIAAYLGRTWQGGLVGAFDHFLWLGQIPVSRSL